MPTVPGKKPENSIDPNSGISEYWYALGTSPGATDIVNWTNNGANTNLTVSGLSLNNGSIYYFSVKSKNGADLWSNIGTSDGFIILNQNSIYNKKVKSINIYPNPSNGIFKIELEDYQNIRYITIVSIDGKIVYKRRVNDKTTEMKLDIQNGVYILKIWEENGRITLKKLLIHT